MSPPRTAWTDDTLQSLRGMIDARLSAEAIAFAYGKTVNAVEMAAIKYLGITIKGVPSTQEMAAVLADGAACDALRARLRQFHPLQDRTAATLERDGGMKKRPTDGGLLLPAHVTTMTERQCELHHPQTGRLSA